MSRIMVALTQCDRCGIQSYDQEHWYSLWYRLPEDSADDPDFDLCPNCAKDFTTFMRKD